MAVLSAFNDKSAQNLQLDAGIIYFLEDNDATIKQALDAGTFDYNVEIGNGGSSKLKCIGATKGGSTFTAVPEVRNILDGFNGVRGHYKGADTVDSWDITLKTTMSEMTIENLERAINTKRTAPIGTTNYEHKITSTIGMIAKESYKDVVWCGKIAGKKQPLVIYLSNVLNMNGVNIATTDKDTGAIEVEFKPHFKLCDDTVPYIIYYPKQ